MLKRFATLTATAAVACVLAAPAYALTVSDDMDVDASAKDVWAKVGEFCSIQEWHPAVAKCKPSKKDGKPHRTLTLGGDGGTIDETQIETMGTGYKYQIDESPLPVENYKATFKVTGPNGEDGGSTVSWSATFDAKEGTSDEDAKKVIDGIFKAGLEQISKMMK